MHLISLKKAQEHLSSIRASGETIGSVHTLGALHRGHGILIQRSAKENTHTVVTVYPNKIQLFPGMKYKYDLAQDVDFALSNGATVVISSTDDEMFSPDFRTYIDQGISHSKLNSSVFSFASRGQVTGSVRWINFTQPTRSYFGLKDIEQAILVKHAVEDLFIPTEIVHVPCIRFSNGVPISSRLMPLDEEILKDIGILYRALDDARIMILHNENSVEKVLTFMNSELKKRLRSFSVLYTTVVDPVDFLEIQTIKIPFILHAAIRYKDITHFDGLYIPDTLQLQDGPPIIWL